MTQPTRRQVLRTGALLPAGALLGAPWVRTARAAAAPGDAPDQDERVLIVVQLTGGNDGLNTVLPVGQDAWYRARPTLSSVAAGRHDLEDGWALHPAMGAMAPLYKEGRLGIVQAVGYPVPDRSHFHSMAIWHTGRVAHLETENATRQDDGWLGTAAAQWTAESGQSPAAVHVGPQAPPASLIHENSPPVALDTVANFQLPKRSKRAWQARERMLSATGGSEELSFLRQGARDARALSERVSAAAGSSVPEGFPASPFGRRLALTSRLIRGGLGARIYSLEVGGFDTHNDQLPLHENLLRTVSNGLAALDADLQASGWADRVVTLVFSEFGRRVHENLSRGTDHGAAGPVFLMGAPVRGGLLGQTPDLEQLERGDLPYTTDFRSIYSDLQSRWLGVRPIAGVEPLRVLEG